MSTDNRDVAEMNHTNGTPVNGHPRGPARSVDEESDQTDENIFLFIPNLIGYSRVVLALASLYFMPLHPRRCGFLYSISCLLDALDGLAARKFQQSTRFGAVLDMITDRCTTTCLLVFLSSAKPAYSMIFQLLISLDFASHYMHMYATLSMGGQGESHKNVSASRSKIMNLYYTNKNVLFVACALNELFFLGLYLLCFSSPRITPALLPSNGGPGNLTSPVSSSPVEPFQPAPSLLFASPFSAAAMEMARANKMSSTVPWILTIVSTPVMAFKQVVNVIQLVKASKWLAEGDRRDRKMAGLGPQAKTEKKVR
ncbi:phosphatidylinositol synthase 1 (CDP-alcohol phosphatidyltransferase1) [Vermiconidia calcicola]|uniref:Phosphatidylinositol synthase 1 (CDP-alcohol phosphatidyltransferase1) n=1 Tax=Vermiconidia calcicola TaxID=1690605 RepID=A0ACC3NY59_9PEZI|nr:phosphatidylinositol synthase 1 (CDP-alcohol phosphatidyltransferase1) [Vermiconidia calcicola]